MSEHARLSLSHADTWLNCAAWPRKVEGFGDEESPESECGNVSHEILQKGLEEGGLSVHPDTYSVETECARVAYDYVQNTWSSMGIEGTQCLAEAQVSISGRDDLWGSADVILYNDDVLEIVDLKTGAGTLVSEVDNAQLQSYAQAAIDTFKIFPKEIRLTIIQPRHWGDEPAIRTQQITLGELAAWNANILLPAAAATDDPEAEGTASVRCKLCAGRHTCEYRDDAVAMELTGESDIPDALKTTMGVTEMAIRDNRDAVVYDNPRLSEILMLIPVIRDYCDALEDHALKILMKGEKVPGYKVIASSGHKKWLDEDAVIAALHKTKVAKNAFKHVLKTPGQVMTLEPSKDLKKKLDGLIVTGSGGKKLALESEKGESIVPAFDAVDNASLPPILREQNPVESTAELPAFLL